MKKIEDYKGTKTAILCTTQQEWDEITALLSYKWDNAKWSLYKEISCINCKDNTYSRKSYYEEHNYTVYPASDFLNNEEQQFLVDKWYKLDNWIVKFKKLKDKINFDGYCINTTSGFTTDGHLSLNNYKPVLITDLTTIQQFLPFNNPDKIKEQPKQEENLVGRWVKKIKSDEWDYKLKVGEYDQIKEVRYNEYILEKYQTIYLDNFPKFSDTFELMPTGWTPDTKQKTMFKKDDYIVLLNEDCINHTANKCYKQRKDSTHIEPYLDNRNSSSNGSTLFMFNRKNWRYATKEEIAEYDRIGKPFDVTTLISKTKDLSTLKDCYIELNSEDEYNALSKFFDNNGWKNLTYYEKYFHPYSDFKEYQCLTGHLDKKQLTLQDLEQYGFKYVKALEAKLPVTGKVFNSTPEYVKWTNQKDKSYTYGKIYKVEKNGTVTFDSGDTCCESMPAHSLSSFVPATKKEFLEQQNWYNGVILGNLTETGVQIYDTSAGIDPYMNNVIEVGDEVEVIIPCGTGSKAIGDRFIVTKIQEVYLSKFGNCTGLMGEDDFYESKNHCKLTKKKANHQTTTVSSKKPDISSAIQVGNTITTLLRFEEEDELFDTSVKKIKSIRTELVEI